MFILNEDKVTLMHRSGDLRQSGTSTLLVTDGGDRFLSNEHNLWNDILPHKSDGYRMPTSIGAQIGANFGATGQKWGGIIDDVVVMGLTGGPLRDGWESLDYIFNDGNAFIGTLKGYSAIDGIHMIDEDYHFIKN